MTVAAGRGGAAAALDAAAAALELEAAEAGCARPHGGTHCGNGLRAASSSTAVTPGLRETRPFSLRGPEVKGSRGQKVKGSRGQKVKSQPSLGKPVESGLQAVAAARFGQRRWAGGQLVAGRCGSEPEAS